MTKADNMLRQELDAARSLLDKDPEAALARARNAAVSQPDSAEPFRLMAAALRRMGRHSEAGQADTDAIGASFRSSILAQARNAMQSRQLQQAEQLIRARLQADPDDVQALRMLAEIAAVCGHAADAERMLRRGIELAPGFLGTYINLAALLQDLGRIDEALALLEGLLAGDPHHHLLLSYKASVLMGLRRMDAAVEIYELMLAHAPGEAATWINYGAALKTVGRHAEAVAAYRKALELVPNSGFAWWGLANLKSAGLGDSDITAMQRALDSGPADVEKVPLHFALGRALGDQGRFEQSFDHYAAGNALRTALTPYDPGQVEADRAKAEALFTPAFLEARAGGGCAAPDPIFILGMPRSGSTLVEQILASHPLVEGADELPELQRIADSIAGPPTAGSSWLDRVASLGADELRALGERYLNAVRVYRTTDRPFFTDKMPSNWRYVGLIRLILPNAKIVDVRRHPLACCFSNFALYFNSRTNFASSLEDLGRYYRAYARMMAHFDRIAPGRVHRLLYEDLVQDPEGRIPSLLDFLQLPFDEACLTFHDNPRAVHTPSAEQVRQPIGRQRLDSWRSYDPWLGPLKGALGPVLDLYPHLPDESHD